MNIGKMLGVMAGLGAAPELLTVLRDFASDHGALPALSADDRRFLDGPVVVHESPWRDTLPAWLPAQAKAERFEIILNGSPGIVGPSEIAAVMYPRTFESPMPHYLADLYIWASTHAAARHFGRDLDDLWKTVGGQRIEDHEVIRPGGRLHDDYRTLAHEIRRKVIAAQKAREPRRPHNAKPTDETKPDNAGFVQLSFYSQLAA